MEAALAKLAKKQWGVFSRAQALAEGMTQRTVNRRVADGTWHQFEKGVYRFPGGFDDWHQRVMAATLALGPNGMASHRTAAFLWGLDVRGGPPALREVLAPRGIRVRIRWAKVHWARRVPEPVKRKGIPCTPVARTLVDLSDIARDEELFIAFDAARRKYATLIADLEKELAQSGGRRNALTLAALVARFKGTPRTDSGLEAKVMWRLSESGLPMPRTQVPVLGPDGEEIARVDFAWMRERIILEADSQQFHLNPVAWNQDLDRRRRLEAAGWRVVHVTDQAMQKNEWLHDLGCLLAQGAVRHP